jgi:glycosyltransferase involved in cell wall biosynthesis
VRAEAEKRVRELGLEEIVRFTGYIAEDETDEFHANADIFVFPTYHDEGFPLVLIKSMAAGTPIITTRVRAAIDHLTEPENCLWVEPRSPAELAGRIGELIDSPALRGRMSENNRRLAEAFRPEAVAAEFIDIYKDLAKKRSAA